MVDLVHSRDSKYLRIRVKFLLTKSIFILVYKWKRREDNSLRIYTLFQCLEMSFFINLVDGEFLKLMSKEEYSFLLRMKSLPYVIFSIVSLCSCFEIILHHKLITNLFHVGLIPFFHFFGDIGLQIVGSNEMLFF